MPKFCVTLTETVRYFVEVEADTEEEAEIAAPEIWANSADPTGDFDGQGEGVQVYLTLQMSS